MVNVNLQREQVLLAQRDCKQKQSLKWRPQQAATAVDIKCCKLEKANHRKNISKVFNISITFICKLYFKGRVFNSKVSI